MLWTNSLSKLLKKGSKIVSYFEYDVNQFNDGKCFLWASFLSNPQKTCTIFNVATVTGSEKSPPGGDTAPTIVTEPDLSAKIYYFSI